MSTVMTPQPTEQFAPTHSGSGLQGALERHVMLISPTMGYWKGQYQLPRTKTKVQIEGKEIDAKNVTTPRSKLITDTYPRDKNGVPWKKRLSDIEKQKDHIIDQMSLKFPIHGIRIVPKARGADFFYRLFGETIGSLTRKIRRTREAGSDLEADRLQDRLEEILGENEFLPNTMPIFDPSREVQSVAYRLRELTAEFVNQYDDIVAQIKKNNPAYEQVKHKLPTVGQLWDKFYIDCVPIEISGGMGANTQELNEMDLADHEDLVRGAVHRHVEEAIETMISGPRDELAKALANLKELISRDGKVTQKSFNPVRAAIAKVRMFDFVANKQLLAQMNNLDTLLGNTVPTSLDSVSAANTGFTSAIERYMEEVEDAEQAAADMERFGREHRAFTFPDDE